MRKILMILWLEIFTKFFKEKLIKMGTKTRKEYLLQMKTDTDSMINICNGALMAVWVLLWGLGFILQGILAINESYRSQYDSIDQEYRWLSDMNTEDLDRVQKNNERYDKEEAEATQEYEKIMNSTKYDLPEVERVYKQGAEAIYKAKKEANESNREYNLKFHKSLIRVWDALRTQMQIRFDKQKEYYTSITKTKDEIEVWLKWWIKAILISAILYFVCISALIVRRQRISYLIKQA